MRISFHKSGEVNGSSHVKFPLRISANLNFESIGKYCFLWSILAKLQPISDSEKGHCKKVSNSKQHFDELNIDGFHSSNGFKCRASLRFEKIYNSSINIFETKFYQHQIKSNLQLIPTDISEDGSKRVINLLIYKNQYFLIGK